MRSLGKFVHTVALATSLIVTLPSVMLAHDVLYPGTVLSVEANRLQVKTINLDTKKEAIMWFTVTTATKVKRGDAVVAYADAKIAKDERLVVVVNHDAEGKDVATELRLAVR